MTTPLRRVSLFVLLSVALACTDATAPAGTVTAVATAEGIKATNGTIRPVFYMAAATDALPLMLWGRCTDASRCTSIASGATLTVPWSSVVQSDPARSDYSFLWWHGPAPLGGQELSGRIEVRR